MSTDCQISADELVAAVSSWSGQPSSEVRTCLRRLREEGVFPKQRGGWNSPATFTADHVLTVYMALRLAGATDHLDTIYAARRINEFGKLPFRGMRHHSYSQLGDGVSLSNSNGPNAAAAPFVGAFSTAAPTFGSALVALIYQTAEERLANATIVPVGITFHYGATRPQAVIQCWSTGVDANGLRTIIDINYGDDGEASLLSLLSIPEGADPDEYVPASHLVTIDAVILKRLRRFMPPVSAEDIARWDRLDWKSAAARNQAGERWEDILREHALAYVSAPAA